MKKGFILATLAASAAGFIGYHVGRYKAMDEASVLAATSIMEAKARYEEEIEKIKAEYAKTAEEMYIENDVAIASSIFKSLKDEGSVSEEETQPVNYYTDLVDRITNSEKKDDDLRKVNVEEVPHVDEPGDLVSKYIFDDNGRVKFEEIYEVAEDLSYDHVETIDRRPGSRTFDEELYNSVYRDTTKKSETTTYEVDERVADEIEPPEQKIIIITHEEYTDEYPHYDKIDMEYWIDERIMMDSNGFPHMGGWDMFGGLLTVMENNEVFDEESLFIRNHDISTDFEIIKREGSPFIDNM